MAKIVRTTEHELTERELDEMVLNSKIYSTEVRIFLRTVEIEFVPSAILKDLKNQGVQDVSNDDVVNSIERIFTNLQKSKSIDQWALAMHHVNLRWAGSGTVKILVDLYLEKFEPEVDS